MKNIKNYCIIALVAITSSGIFFACSSDNEQVQKNVSSTNIVKANRIAATICDITGATVVSSGSAVVASGSTATYNYTNNTGNATIITWTLTGSGATFSGTNGATTLTTTSPVNVIYSSSFVSGTLSVIGSGGTAQTCNTILNITRSLTTVPGGTNPGGTDSGGTGSDCVCPNPKIRCVLSNYNAEQLNGHAYFRLQLENLQQGESYAWSALNAQIISGINTTYIIVKPLVPVNGVFEVYCTVTKVCSNGTITKRKALYRNFLGGTCANSYNGFINIGNVCDTPVSGGGSNPPLGSY